MLCEVILGKAGTDIEKYSSDSTRSSNTSTAKIKAPTLSEIDKAEGWKGDINFQTFLWQANMQNIWGIRYFSDMQLLTNLSGEF